MATKTKSIIIIVVIIIILSLISYFLYSLHINKLEEIKTDYINKQKRESEIRDSLFNIFNSDSEEIKTKIINRTNVIQKNIYLYSGIDTTAKEAIFSENSKNN